ncbi:MAG TPA: Rid family detoxifying hydrolase [Candidatus Lokiarchaeia archaeon]|nr:Rid family detoxifying hydrolase [Candidatus Lokiarchaeia archaeon]
MSKSVVKEVGNLKAVGPYSLAVDAGNFIFVSGQLGIDPETGDFAGDDIAIQVEQVFQNIRAIVGQLGLGLDAVAKVDVFLKDIHDFSKLNDVYQRVFEEACPDGDFPARATAESPNLPKGALVEIAVTCVK